MLRGEEKQLKVKWEHGMAEMNVVDWRNLETVEAGSVMLDMRSVLDKVQIPAFLKLYARGYCSTS